MDNFINGMEKLILDKLILFMFDRKFCYGVRISIIIN